MSFLKYGLAISSLFWAGAVQAETIKLKNNNLDKVNSQPSYSEAQKDAIRYLRPITARIETRGDLLTALQENFQQLDPEGDGVRKIEADKQALVRNAQLRARELSKWLTYDLDGDGDVDDAELLAFAAQPIPTKSRVKIMPTPEQALQIQKALKSTLKLPDPNKDGTSDFSEMLAAAQMKIGKGKLGIGSSLLQQRHTNMINYDTDKNGVTSDDEFITHLLAAYDMFDADASGTLSTAELRELRNADLAILREDRR